MHKKEFALVKGYTELYVPDTNIKADSIASIQRFHKIPFFVNVI